jgi:hypothetical protein
VAYFHTNPFLVVISWIVALGGEAMEKAGIGGKRGKFVFKTYRTGPMPGYQEDIRSHTVINNKDDAIEAEFTKKS